MASGSVEKTVSYPPRYYGDGRIPAQKKSMHHYCVLGNIGMLKDSLGADVWRYLSNSPVGGIVKLVDGKFIWSAKTVHNMLTRQLATEKNHEIWCLVDDQPIRFSLCEFAAILGMNSEPYEDAGICEADHSELWGDMKVALSDGPSWDELVEVLTECRTWTYEKRRMVGCLCVLAVGVLGLHPVTKIPLNFAKMVLDVEAFEKFMWGRVACESLIQFVKLADYNSTSYTIGGFGPILQIWVYEAVTIVGEMFGNKIDGIEVPLMSWRGSRKRFDFDAIILEDKNKNKKVRVKHIFVNDGEEPKPKWTDDIDDAGVDKLLEDIFRDRLAPNAWKVEMRKKGKPKEPLAEGDDDFVEERVARTPKNAVKNNKRKGETIIKEGDKVTKVRRNPSAEKVTASVTASSRQSDGMVEGIMKLIEALSSKVESMDSNLTTSIANLKREVDRKMLSMEAKVDGKIDQVQNEVKLLKNVKKIASKEVVHSSGSLNDDRNSKDPI